MTTCWNRRRGNTGKTPQLWQNGRKKIKWKSTSSTAGSTTPTTWRRINSAKVGAWGSPPFIPTLISTKKREDWSPTASTGSLWSTSSEFFFKLSTEACYLKIHKKYIIRSVLTTQSLFKFIFAYFVFCLFFSFLIKTLNNRTALAPLSEQQAKFWIYTVSIKAFKRRMALQYDETNTKYPVRLVSLWNKDNSFVCEKINGWKFFYLSTDFYFALLLLNMYY